MALLHGATSSGTPSLRTRLVSERLVLRPPQPSDVAEFRHLLRKNDAHLRPWSPLALPGEDPTSILFVASLLTRQRRDWRRGHQFVFLLLRRSHREAAAPAAHPAPAGDAGTPAPSGEEREAPSRRWPSSSPRSTPAGIVGRITLGGLLRGAFQNAYLGYWIDADHQGRGLMAEALPAVLDFAFGEARLHRVQIAIMPKNTPSLRVAEKMGFRREGYAERYLSIAGAWEDHAIFAITAEEWQARA